MFQLSSTKWQQNHLIHLHNVSAMLLRDFIPQRLNLLVVHLLNDATDEAATLVILDGQSAGVIELDIKAGQCHFPCQCPQSARSVAQGLVWCKHYLDDAINLHLGHHVHFRLSPSSRCRLFSCFCLCRRCSPGRRPSSCHH